MLIVVIILYIPSSYLNYTQKIIPCDHLLQILTLPSPSSTSGKLKSDLSSLSLVVFFFWFSFFVRSHIKLISSSIYFSLTYFTQHNASSPFIVTNGMMSSFFMAGSYSVVYVYNFIPLMDFRLFPYHGYCKEGWYKHEVQVSFQVSVLIAFGNFPRSGVAISYGISSFIFLGNSMLLSTVPVPIYNPTNRAQGFPFLHIHINIFLTFHHFVFYQ